MKDVAGIRDATPISAECMQHAYAILDRYMVDHNFSSHALCTTMGVSSNLIRELRYGGKVSRGQMIKVAKFLSIDLSKLLGYEPYTNTEQVSTTASVQSEPIGAIGYTLELILQELRKLNQNIEEMWR